MDLERLLTRGVAETIVKEELSRKISSGQPLRLKQGFDPTRPDIHLGHAVGLRKLRQFQNLGHQVILIVGDWTAQIGDPSGQSATRRMLSAEEVRANAQAYLQQFFKIVDCQRTEVRWQSEWYDKFGLADVIKLTSKFTVAQMLVREDFAKRYAAGSPIAITELLYPLLQAYDSVAIRAEVEFGGIDQKFNILAGRELQRLVGQEPQQVVLVPLLVGTDGVNAMSQSRGNYIGITEPADQMYGKVMSLPDHVMMDYFEWVTDVPDEELAEMKEALLKDKVNPRDIKMRLAREIVSQFHSYEAALEAEEEFKRVFQQRQLPSEMPTLYLDRARYGVDAVPITTVMLETGLVKSRSEAKRMIVQGGVRLDGRLIMEEGQLVVIENGAILRVGKRRFVRLAFKD
ncbi:MAG: tyrosine--tRNA ligase [Chloroflexi bacterium]|nr:tyrosine--tRNA ligase [Chloroflexota bacterium]MCL5075422.1 tyrosine--tRNA ligase [Chloroflexota bacterium]